MPRTSKLPLHPRKTFAASPIDRWRRAQYHRGMKRSTSCRAAQRAFVPLLCAALLAGCTRAKDTQAEAAAEPAPAEAITEPASAAETQPAAAPEPEPSLQDILAAYRNDAPYQEAQFIRDVELEDGSTALLFLKDGQATAVDTNWQQVVANPLLPDKRCKVGIPWDDIPYRCTYDGRFIPVKDGGKWTYADGCRSGTLLAPAVFDAVHPFKDGLGAVQYKGLWGFINGDGQLAIEPQFDSVQDFYNGICIVEFLKDGSRFHGGIAPDGTLLFSLPDESSSAGGVSHIYNFYENDIAKATQGNASCAIARDGTILLQNLTSGKIESSWLTKPSFDFSYRDGTLCLSAFFDEAAYAKTGSESKSTFYGAFSKQGAWVIEPVHKEPGGAAALLEPSATTAATAKKDAESGLSGVADAEGNWLLEPQFAKVSRWGTKSAPYFVVTDPSGKVGIADGSGTIVLPVECERVSSMHMAEPVWFTVEQDGKYGIVDGSGTVLIPFAYAWNAPEITDFDYDQYAAGEFPFDRSAFTDNPADIVRKTSQGLVFSFHPLAAEEREPKKKYATCYRVRVFAKDGTELFSDRAFYEEYREDGV